MTAQLLVSEIFGPTFQGEGPTAGRRAGFVRLARCNLDCAWCDTAYTWDWKRYDRAGEVSWVSAGEVLRRLDEMGVERIVITGGEPLLQQAALEPLLRLIAARRWATEVETNGTVVPSAVTAGLVDRFNVSPKLASSEVGAQRRLNPVALQALCGTGKAVFKFVATNAADLDEIAGLVEEFHLTPVWVMPEGTTTDALLRDMRALAGSVLDRGWNLTSRLQILLWGDERAR